MTDWNKNIEAVLDNIRINSLYLSNKHKAHEVVLVYCYRPKTKEILQLLLLLFTFLKVFSLKDF